MERSFREDVTQLTFGASQMLWWRGSELLRPMSHRARCEPALMDESLAAVVRCATLDHRLACGVALLPGFVRGYGEVRRREGYP